MAGFARDLRHGVRGLLGTPGYTAVCLITLALGIGATTAVFSVVNGVVLRPLPFPAPERLVLLQETVRRDGVERRPLSALDFLDWRARARSFESLAAVASVTLTLPGDTPERIFAELVSSGYVETYGVKPLLGRTFLLEDEIPGGRPVALLSHALWRRRFGADPAIVGRVIQLSGARLEVAGVLPEGFHGLDESAEAWIPLGQAALAGRADDLEDRGSRWLAGVGRLAPGATLESSQLELDAVARDLAAAHPDTNADRGALVLSMRDEVLGSLRRALGVLMGAVAFVLLLACANLANLTLARSSERRRELAIRASLGAGRRTLARQLVAESVVLGLAGGALGLVVAWWGRDALLAVSPVELPVHTRVDLDARVLAFAAAAALLTPLLFGLGPALLAARADLNAVLKEGGRGGGAETVGRRRVAHALVVAQVALALLLTVGGGLTLRSLLHVSRVDTGFRAENLVSMEVDLPESTEPEAAAAFVRTLLERVRGLPDVRAAAIGSDSPLNDESSARMGVVEAAGAEREFRYYVHRVTPGFFATMGTPLLGGREFSAADGAGEPVVVVAEGLAKRFWPGADPLGRRIKLGSDPEAPWATVVGVAGEVRHRTLVDDPEEWPNDPDVYVPLVSRSDPDLSLVVRTRRDPASVVPGVRRELRALAPAVPVSEVETLTSRLGREMAGRRFLALLLATFAGLALALAAVGIHGLLATWVARRTHEVGVRMALGARAVDVLRSVVGQGVGLALLGVAVGSVAAVGLTRVLTSLLVGVSARDPVTFAGVALLLLTVAAAASWIPARRATGLDPARVLRAEL